MRRSVLVYVCGPCVARKGQTVEENIAVAIRATLGLLSLGIPAACAHSLRAFPSAWASYGQHWTDYGKRLIDRSTHVLLLPRWESDPAVLVEVDYAKTRGLQVFETVDLLRRA